MSAEQRLKIYVVNGSDGLSVHRRCLLNTRCLLFKASINGGSTVYASHHQMIFKAPYNYNLHNNNNNNIYIYIYIYIPERFCTAVW